MDAKQRIVEAVHSCALQLGYPSVRTHQLNVICKFLEGRDVFAVLPTGYGKSLCYALLPLVFDSLSGSDCQSTRAIVMVLTPLLAIMKDQVGCLAGILFTV